MAASINAMVAMYALNMSLTEIANATDVAVSTVRCRLVAAGVTLRSRTEGVRLASQKLSRVRRGRKRRPFSAAHRHHIGEARRRNAVGVSVKPSGYVEFTTGPNKGRSVHVVTVEAAIGRRLARDEVVHHIDGNRANNDRSNLQLMTRAAHAALHQEERHGR